MNLLSVTPTFSSIPVLPENKCIAKKVGDTPGMLTEEHCRIVGYVTIYLRRYLPLFLRSRIPAGIGIIGACHDVGKISPGFLLKIYGELLKYINFDLYSEPIEKFETLHAVISEAALLKYHQVVAKIEGGHHGRRSVVALPEDSARYGGPEWQRLRDALIHKLISEFGNFPKIPKTKYAKEFIAALVCLSDWIGSDENNFSALGGNNDIPTKAKQIASILSWNRQRIRKNRKFGDLFKDKFGKAFKPNALQKKLMKVVTKPGLYIVEADTGLGKTEAAEYAAYTLLSKGFHDGLYFALPTMLTSNKIYERVQPFLDRAFKTGVAPKLIHSESWMMNLPEAPGTPLSPGGYWFTPNRRAMLLPFGVGTVDQALLAVLRSKFNFVRIMALANKVVILDEIHSYDIYTGSLLNVLIKMLRDIGCTVIILSATLTTRQKKELLKGKKMKEDNRYPLITSVIGKEVKTYSVKSENPREYKIKYRRGNLRSIKNDMIKKVRKGASVLWTTNFVQRTVDICKMLESDPRLSGVPIGILHGRYPSWRREIIECEWISNPQGTAYLGKDLKVRPGCILIATQIVEQSVDIDADLLITDLAPSDMLIQRMGRCWRHRRKNRPKGFVPEVWIIDPGLKGVKSAESLTKILGVHALIYAPFSLWRSHQVWSKKKSVKIPSEIRDILDKTHKDYCSDDPVWLGSIWKEFCEDREELKEYAESLTGSHVDYIDDDLEGYHTRYLKVPHIEIILAKSIQVFPDHIEMVLVNNSSVRIDLDPNKKKKDREASKELFRNRIRVNKTTLQGQKGFDGDLVVPEWMASYTSCNSLPVLVDSDGNIKIFSSGRKTKYFYTDRYGIHRRG